MLIPGILRQIPASERWGHLDMLEALVARAAVPKAQTPVLRMLSIVNRESGNGGKGSRKDVLKRHVARRGRGSDDEEDGEVRRESWEAIVKRKKKEERYRQILRDLQARMDFYRRQFASRTIQVRLLGEERGKYTSCSCHHLLSLAYLETLARLQSTSSGRSFSCP